MRWWQASVAGVGLLGALVISPAGAQEPPTLTASPSAADPGDTITVTAAGCDEAPRIGYQVVDGSGATFEADTTPSGDGTFSTELAAPVGDLFIYFAFGECDGASARPDAPTALVDVEAPLLYALGSPELPEDIYGTDCPTGATPEVTVTTQGQSYDVVALEVDDFGDWSFNVLSTLPVVPAGPSTVEATCGSVTYETLALNPPGGGPTTSTESVPTSEATPPGSNAPPATPVSGAAQFTG